MSKLMYDVPAMHCGHCEAAVKREVEQVDGVETVEVDLETKHLTVRGEDVSDRAVREAIGAAGFEIGSLGSS